MFHSTITDTPAIARMPVQKIKASSLLETDDSVAVEEPLEIRLHYGPSGNRAEQGISVTLRTPGHDTCVPTPSSIKKEIYYSSGKVSGGTMPWIKPSGTPCNRDGSPFRRTSSCSAAGPASS